ncbi:MAG: AMP-binding protein [Acidimicrobiia bacterium]
MTEPEPHRSTPVVDRLEEWASRQPNAPALIDGHGTTSYVELRNRISQVAGGVLEAVGDDSTPVAVLARRPAVAIPAMIGVLKAGQTYVPIDPHDLIERVEHKLRHSTAGLVITSDEHLDHPALANVGVPAVSFESSVRFARPLPEVSMVHPAYILYTSGSTGRPKGVVHSQPNLVNKADLLAETLAVRPTDRLSLLFSPTTGASTSDIYGALLNGAAVVPFDLQSRGLQDLGGWLTENRVTVLHTLPTVLRRFLEVVDPGSVFRDVRMLVLTGESVLQTDLDLFRRHFSPQTKLVHRLSSTETGGMACLTMDTSTAIEDEILPVGRAMPGRTIRLLDDQGREVSAGEKGEISVESEFLALGYWQDQELTDQAFTRTALGHRRFQTGDIARVGRHGNLEFLGRRAGRLKIAGHTIETREVELALQAIGRFKELAVVGREETPGSPEMAAFYVPADNAEGWHEDLRTALLEQIPAHMVPSRFIELGTLPLTPLGKIDRPALPWPSTVEDHERLDFVAPEGELETDLAEIWQSVFGLTRVGALDNFFDLGGTSIQSFSMFALLARRRAVDLPPTTIARAPTIRQLARLVEDSEETVRSDNAAPSTTATWEHLVPLRPGGDKSPLFCLHGGEGYTLSFRKLAERLGPGRPVYGLDALALDGHDKPLNTVQSIASRYIDDIKTVQPTGPYLLAGYSFGGTVGFEIAQQLSASGDEVGLLCLLDAVRSGDSLRASRRRQRGRFLRAVWLGMRRTGARARGANIDVAGRTARRLLREVPLRLLIDLAPRGLLRRYCDRRLSRGLPVQHALRQPYYFDLHSQASHSYAPQTYEGRVAVIAARGETEARRVEWNDVVLGGLDISELDCEHMEMFLEPHVAQLAVQVQGLLDRA